MFGAFKTLNLILCIFLNKIGCYGVRGMNTIFNTNLFAADVLEGLKQMAVERLGEGGHCW